MIKVNFRQLEVLIAVVNRSTGPMCVPPPMNYDYNLLYLVNRKVHLSHSSHVDS